MSRDSVGLPAAASAKAGALVCVVAACIVIGVRAEQGQPRASSYHVQLAGPVLDAWKAAITEAGGQIGDYMPPFGFRVRMEASVAGRVRQLAFVTAVTALRGEDKLARDLVRNGRRLYVARLEPGTDAAAIESAARAAGVNVLRRTGSMLMIDADGSQLAALAEIDGVSSVDNFTLRIKHNEYGGGAIVGGNTALAAGYDGSTQTIAIADTGLGGGTAATAHGGIAASRIASVFNWAGVPDFCFETISNDGPIDVDTGHGTHVATTALGDAAAGGVGRGTAPAARLVFQALENYATPSLLCEILYGVPPAYYLVGIPDNVGDLFLQAYQEGARVHSNSWGAEVAGAYNADAANADAFLWTHRDLAVTVSAGNSGVDGDLDGEVDLGSLNSPATAKNVITVGASENDRQGHWECDASLTYTACAAQGGQNAIFTYGSGFPDRYAVGPLAADPSAGNAEQMAAFSSRGPTADGRIKPDVVAPGTWMLSGYSSLFQQQYDPLPNPATGFFQYDGWGFPLDSQYKYMGGTSMAAPLVAGAAAVVRDYYLKARGHDASGALVKAQLINSAVDLLDENNDGVLDNASPIPNLHEGWGRIDLAGATDGSEQFFDETSPLSTGTTASYPVNVTTTGAPLKVTLVWTDYPGSTAAPSTLVNDLDLSVVAPDGTTYAGNVFAGGWSNTGGPADRVNNVENVYVFAAAAGTWTVNVTGYNVPSGPQPFALVVDLSAAGAGLPVVRATLDVSAASEAGPVDGVIRFMRSGDTSAPLTVDYTVGGTASPGTDYAALMGTVIIPDGASTATVLVDVTDDTLYEPVETVVVTITDNAAYVVGSPSTATVSLASNDLPPDLTISTMLVPSVAGAGGSITVTDTTRNNGTGVAPPSATGFYLSSNNSWDAADTFLGERPVGQLAPGTTESLPTSLDLPPDLTTGNYYVIAKADFAGAVSESSETNNVRSSAAMKVGPDLLVTAVTAPSSGAAGEDLQVTETTKNQGGGGAGASATTFYLSSNTLLDGSDTPLGSRPVDPLGANATSQVQTTLTLPLNTLVGSYYILAQADGGSGVQETLETNNVKASALVRVGADLTLTALAAPAAAGAGDVIRVSDTTANIGAGEAAESFTSFYLSVNSTVEAGDPVLGSRAVPPLDAGASHLSEVDVTIPLNTVTGTYWLIGLADGPGAVAETSETNNIRRVQIKIGPDLSLTTVTPAGDSAPGASLTVTDATKNAGGGTAPASETAFYLSLNSTLDASDHFMGVRTIPALAPGEINTAPATLTVPAIVPIGVYYVLAKADNAGTVAEVLETNNVKSGGAVQIGPDLLVSALTAPTSAVRGVAFSVTDTTRNDGGSSTTTTTTSYYLSTNTTLDAGDPLLGSRTVNPLSPAGFEVGGASITIPVTQATGTYYLIAKADGPNATPEASETNNIRTRSIKVNP
jgi:subtilase family serine protease/subtilisin family serine protease